MRRTQLPEWKVVHPDVSCDMCQETVVGPRYRCNICLNFESAFLRRFDFWNLADDRVSTVCATSASPDRTTGIRKTIR